MQKMPLRYIAPAVAALAVAMLASEDTLRLIFVGFFGAVTALLALSDLFAPNRKASLPPRGATVLITGATYGIGYELAKLFASNGYNLILIARTKEKLQTVAKELESQYKIKVLKIISKDLSEGSAAKEIFEELKRDSLSVDILVNNAGFGARGLFSSFGADEAGLKLHQQMINCNITSLVLLTQLCLPGMLVRRSGWILNIASTAAMQPGPMQSVYYASKAFVLSFSRALAFELTGSGVGVTVACPGPVATPWMTRAKMENTRILKLTRVATAEETAQAAFEAMRRGDCKVVLGLMNRVMAWLVRFSPTNVIMAVVWLLNGTTMGGAAGDDAKSGMEDQSVETTAG